MRMPYGINCEPKGFKTVSTEANGSSAGADWRPVYTLAGVGGGGGGGGGVIFTVMERSVPPVAQLRVSGNSSCWCKEKVLKHCHRQG
jgi:hypothetical protein